MTEPFLPDGKFHAPATRRNRGPILDILRGALPERGLVLEIASGTGEHAEWFARRLPGLTWQPSEPDPEMRAAVAARCKESGLANLLRPLDIDVEEGDWGVAAADAIVCINMIHVAPWPVCAGLMMGAGRTLAEGGPLYLYGPFMKGGRHTAPSNQAFDAALRAHDPEWGVRDLDEVVKLAGNRGLAFVVDIEMPANNLSVLFRRR